MKINAPRFLFAAFALFAVWLLCPAQPAAAQERWDDRVIIKRPTERRIAKVKSTRPVRQPRRTIARVRPTRPAAGSERAALLTLQWRIIKFDENGTQDEVSSGSKFAIQDKVRLAVKVNQDGYLYIIRRKETGADGQIVFPDKRYNSGSNEVKKDQEFFLPSDCQDFKVPCWYSVQPPAGQELFTLVFSREPVDALPGEAPETEAEAVVTSGLLGELLSASAQILRRSQGVVNSRFTIWIRNTNQDDNEEIIETVVLNKGDAAATTTTANAASGTPASSANGAVASPPKN